MANDRDDFLPEIRNSAWWASDTRQVMNGKAVEVIMQKQGKIDPPDLSQIEAVQMGHVMQPIIGRLAQDRLNMELKDADYPLTHPDHSWLRSHFDFISADGRVLVEAKNYNINARNKFDADTNRIPPADYAQILHEATVHRVDRVILAVLFGGQEFQTFDFTFSEEEKENLIKDMAVYWGHVKADTLPEPQSLEAMGRQLGTSPAALAGQRGGDSDAAQPPGKLFAVLQILRRPLGQRPSPLAGLPAL